MKRLERVEGKVWIFRNKVKTSLAIKVDNLWLLGWTIHKMMGNKLGCTSCLVRVGSKASLILITFMGDSGNDPLNFGWISECSIIKVKKFELHTRAKIQAVSWERCPFSNEILTFWNCASKNSKEFHVFLKFGGNFDVQS